MQAHQIISTIQKCQRGPMAAVVVALLIGTMIAASAITGSHSAGLVSGSPFFKSQQLGTGFETNLW
jgi:hypothetical protein